MQIERERELNKKSNKIIKELEFNKTGIFLTHKSFIRNFINY